ncbi:MAG: flagellar filament outer layer protein FlaA [Spirochaetaceae bacterium]
MRRSFILALIALVLLTGTVLAEEATLIDFTQLTPDWPADDPQHNSQTIVDFSRAAGSSYTDEERAEMKISLAIPDWEVNLSSSSENVTTVSNSEVRLAPVREGASEYGGDTVMGARVFFPEEPHNGWALITPPFEIPAYADTTEIDDDGSLTVPQDEEGAGRKFDNYGVVKNVGVLRSVTVTVNGLNFPHGLSIVMMDENNEEREIFMGYLDFDGWRDLTWMNPNYINDVRNRELRSLPLYPNLAPMRRLVGIRVYRDASMEGGDFVTYIRDISLTYDRAVLQLERDINDEQVWGILQDREAARRDAELRNLGNIQVLRYLEQRKMHSPEDMNGENGENGDE